MWPTVYGPNYSMVQVAPGEYGTTELLWKHLSKWMKADDVTYGQDNQFGFFQKVLNSMNTLG